MNIKKLTLGLLASAFTFVLVFSFLISLANAGTSELTGWGWSPNVGHISMNCSNTNTCATSNYKVLIATSTATDGVFSGYAWSSNIGWIKFDGDGTPAHPGPTINLGTGAVEGWIRACAGTVNKDCASADRTDGWDGWMKLSEPGTIYPTLKADGSGGLTYDPATGQFVGYAWGGLLGWITFKPNVPPPSNTVCKGCTPDPEDNGITANCLINPADITITPPNTTTTITPSVGSYSGGVSPYTYSPRTFTLGVGVGQINSVTVTDSSVPPKTGVVACNPVTVNMGVAPSVLNMWLKPSVGADNQNLSSIKVKVGEDVKLNWASSIATLGSCEGFIGNNPVPDVGTKLDGSYLTLPALAKGTYKYSMSCVNFLDGNDVVARAPNDRDYLLITVGDSKIIEQ